jgi:PAS domain S-box-containing protein
VLASAPVGCAVLDRELRFVVVNDTLAALDGVPKDGHVGRTIAEIVPQLAPLIEPVVRGVLRDGVPVLGLEVSGQVAAALHEGRHYMANYFPVRSDDGEILGVAGAIADITETKRIEVERQQARVRAETAEAEARAASRAKDDFVAILAHELRNPMNVILQAVAALERTGSQEPEPARTRAMIRRQTERVARLLEDLLDMNRIVRGDLDLRRVPVDTSAAVDLAAEAHRHRVAAKRQTLTVSLPDEPVAVAADAARLDQIVGNLIDNASKYTPAGGVISVSLAVEGGMAVVRVRDNGRGIPAEHLESIFDLFGRVPGSARIAETGLGIGLGVVKRLVEAHGGTVHACSDGPGKGSEFVVRLPMIREGPRR